MSDGPSRPRPRGARRASRSRQRSCVADRVRTGRTDGPAARPACRPSRRSSSLSRRRAVDRGPDPRPLASGTTRSATHLGARCGGAAGPEEPPADPADHDHPIAGREPVGPGRGVGPHHRHRLGRTRPAPDVSSRSTSESPDGRSRRSAARDSAPLDERDRRVVRTVGMRWHALPVRGTRSSVGCAATRSGVLGEGVQPSVQTLPGGCDRPEQGSADVAQPASGRRRSRGRPRPAG